MKIIATNKKARFDYQLLKTLEAGIELKGSEIKSIREGRVNLKESYVKLTDNMEVIVINMHIGKYQENIFDSISETRTRKLLLHKKEIIKLNNEVLLQGNTIVPTKLYLKGSKAKLEIAVAKGKKLHDKRQVLKEKTINREIEKQLKKY